MTIECAPSRDATTALGEGRSAGLRIALREAQHILPQLVQGTMNTNVGAVAWVPCWGLACDCFAAK